MGDFIQTKRMITLWWGLMALAVMKSVQLQKKPPVVNFRQGVDLLKNAMSTMLNADTLCVNLYQEWNANGCGPVTIDMSRFDYNEDYNDEVGSDLDSRASGFYSDEANDNALVGFDGLSSDEVGTTTEKTSRCQLPTGCRLVKKCNEYHAKCRHIMCKSVPRMECKWLWARYN